MYGNRLSNFPEKYNRAESPLNYKHDPDWYHKIEYNRLHLKKWILILFFGYWALQWRVKNVEGYDRRKR